MVITPFELTIWFGKSCGYAAPWAVPVPFLLTPGQASDKTTAPALLDGLHLARGGIVDLITAHGANADILF